MEEEEEDEVQHPELMEGENDGEGEIDMENVEGEGV